MIPAQMQDIDRALHEMPETVLPEITRGCSPGMCAFLAAVFMPGMSTAKELAGVFGLHPSTVISRFARAQLPSPRHYLARAQLVKAAVIVTACPNTTVANVANLLRSSSPQSFGRFVRHEAGCTALEYCARVHLPDTIARYRAELVEPYLSELQYFVALCAPTFQSRLAARREAA